MLHASLEIKRNNEDPRQNEMERAAAAKENLQCTPILMAITREQSLVWETKSLQLASCFYHDRQRISRLISLQHYSSAACDAHDAAEFPHLQSNSFGMLVFSFHPEFLSPVVYWHVTRLCSSRLYRLAERLGTSVESQWKEVAFKAYIISERVRGNDADESWVMTFAQRFLQRATPSINRPALLFHDQDVVTLHMLLDSVSDGKKSFDSWRTGEKE